MYLNAWPVGTSTIRRCGLVGVCVALLEECVTIRAGFEVSHAKAMPSVAHTLRSVLQDLVFLDAAR